MVQKLLLAYGISGSQSETVISHMAKFDFIVTEFYAGGEQDASRIKAINPNVKIVGYRDVMFTNENAPEWSEIDQHEEWFLHDINGNRLIHVYYQVYALDVRDPGWQNYYANMVKSYIERYGFDGVFCDDVWEFTEARKAKFGIDLSLFPENLEQTWHNGMVQFLANLKATLGNKLVIANTWAGYSDYIARADGFLMEEFMNYNGQVELDSHINWKNKIRLCHSRGEFVEKTYSLASYLIGANYKAYWGRGGYHFLYDPVMAYQPEMDIDEGRPIGTVSKENSIYERTFEHLKVQVNLESETGEIVEEETEYPKANLAPVIILALLGLGE